ncbi:fibronectin type III domain-containing protein [Aureibaculum conchae]|uniref:fibronectin type III domain-containing protein n=1 Tax=Aureibaculum sp. 2308TA14-22 TaxID=3108392 RepID=UPI00339620A7
MSFNINKTIFKFAFLLTLTLSVSNCSSGNDGPNYDTNLIIQSTEANIETTFTSLKVNGKLLSDNGIVSKGICWSETSKPTINNNKITETTTTFSSLIENLNPNTTYYFRVFATSNSGTTYSQEKSFTTASLEETYWQFIVTDHNGNDVSAKVNLYEDGSTKYVRDNCPTCYVPLGTWSLNGKNLTYIGENADPALSRHVFYGTVTGMSLQGTYEHIEDPDGTWSAVLLP